MRFTRRTFIGTSVAAVQGGEAGFRCADTAEYSPLWIAETKDDFAAIPAT